MSHENRAKVRSLGFVLLTLVVALHLATGMAVGGSESGVKISKLPLRAGDKTIKGKMSKEADTVEIRINGSVADIEAGTMEIGKGNFKLTLEDALEKDQKVAIVSKKGNEELHRTKEVTVKGKLVAVVHDLPFVVGRGRIEGKVPDDATAIEVHVNDQKVSTQDSETTIEKGRFSVILQSTPEKGERVHVVAMMDTKELGVSEVFEVKGTYADERETIGATWFVGMAIDTFASGDTQLFLNPEASGGTEERAIGGFSFAYRLRGAQEEVKKLKESQLWFYGETVHGMRSSEVDCDKNPTVTVCTSSSGTPTPSDALYIIRNSSSLEAFFGLRWEFQTLQKGTEAAANLYLNAQAGFVTVADGPDDVSDLHHVGLGLTSIKGTYKGSYVELGFGRNDLFADKNKERLKVDAFLTTPLSKSGQSFFVQLNVDADLGSGSDTIQTYLGVEFDLKQNPFKW